MPAKLTAVLGACKRRGRWQVSSSTKAFVLFGHCYIDYREAYADDELEKMKLSVLCVLGNATFIVPEGADIQPSVVSLLASTAFDVPEIEGEPPLPTLVIESTTLLGRCRVLTNPPGEETVQEGGDASAVDLPVEPVRVDRIGPDTADVAAVMAAVREAELPPLEAVAKALLAEPTTEVSIPSSEAVPSEAPTPHTEVIEPGDNNVAAQEAQPGLPEEPQAA